VGEVFGPYRVHEQLGTGGMAVVHRAEHSEDGTVVALKRVLPQFAHETTYLRRFVDEARLGQRLRHPHIVTTYAVGCIAGTHYITFEYVRGPTLLHILQRSSRTEPIPIYIALHVITRIARALAYAHTLREPNGQPLQLIHRDIAPSNIIVSDTGATKLIDFGVAKSTVTHVHTGARTMVGRLGYVAPEYLRGKCDARVDLYSLGVVAYELLTARPLFTARNLKTAELLRSYELEPPSRQNAAVPLDLDDIVMTALARDPDRRWQNAFAMYKALTTLADDSGLDVAECEVAKWLASMQLVAAPAEPARPSTSEIGIDVDNAFADIVARTRSQPAVTVDEAPRPG
jgi:eukaryotic-like serine/threonine-protein kinase